MSKVISVRNAKLIAGLIIIGLLFSSCQRQNQANQSHKLVITSPEVAEIVCALGAVKEIVGVSEECDYPLELKEITKVGQFGKLNREQIVALNPELIFTSGLEQNAMADELTKLGMKVVVIYPKTIDEMLQSVRLIGRLIGQEQKGVDLADSLNRELDQYRKITTSAENKPKVYLEINRDPLMSVSDHSYVGELIELSGGDNIFTELERDYARVKAEDVIKADPDIIICYSQDTIEHIRNRMGWQKIKAIRNNRIYFEKDINPDWIQRACPRMLLGLKRLREIYAQG